MLNALIIWAAKQLAAYALEKLAKRLGVEEAASHAATVIAKYNPPPEDPLPSPREQQNPKPSWLR
jgi:hypothetical protein